MKTTFKTLALIALIGFTTACSNDDDDALKIQAHYAVFYHSVRRQNITVENFNRHYFYTVKF